MKDHEVIMSAYLMNMLNRIENHRRKFFLIAIGAVLATVGIALSAHHGYIFHACVNTVALAYFAVRYHLLETAIAESLYLMPHNDIDFRVQRLREIASDISERMAKK